MRLNFQEHYCSDFFRNGTKLEEVINAMANEQLGCYGGIKAKVTCLQRSGATKSEIDNTTARYEEFYNPFRLGYLKDIFAVYPNLSTTKDGTRLMKELEKYA